MLDGIMVLCWMELRCNVGWHYCVMLDGIMVYC